MSSVRNFAGVEAIRARFSTAQTDKPTNMPLKQQNTSVKSCQRINSDSKENICVGAKMLRLLIVSCSVAPDISGSAIVVSNIASQFNKLNMAIVGEKVCLETEPHIIGDPEIAYVSRRYFANLPGRRFIIPVIEAGEFPILAYKIFKKAKFFNATHIVTVFPSARYLAAGYLAAKGANIPFYPYYHNTYVENQRGISKVIARLVQSIIFRGSQHIFVISDGLLELFNTNYPLIKNVSSLVHSFSGDLPQRKELPCRRGELRLAMIGSINDSCLDAVRRFIKVVALHPEAKLLLHTSTPKRVLNKWGLLGERVILSKDVLSREELLKKIGDCDILLLPHGLVGRHSVMEYNTIFPTRTIEYMLAQKPILAHAPEGCFLTKFLRDNSCAIVVTEPDERVLLSALVCLSNDLALCEKIVDNATRTVTQFHAPLVAERLKSFL